MEARTQFLATSKRSSWHFVRGSNLSGIFCLDKFERHSKKLRDAHRLTSILYPTHTKANNINGIAIFLYLPV